MKLSKAIKLLVQEYEKAKKLEFVHNPIAYALYRVWKIADNEEKNKHEKKRKNCNV